MNGYIIFKERSAMKKCCLTCKYARKALAENSGVVGCIKYNVEMNGASDYEPSLADFITTYQSKLFDKPDALIGTGWVYTGAYPETKSNGMFGLQTNGILVVQKDNKCQQYESRLDK